MEAPDTPKDSRDPAAVDDRAGLEVAPPQYIDVEFSLGGLDSPDDLQRVEVALKGLSGIHSSTVRPGSVSAIYDPLTIGKSQLVAALQAAGVRVQQVVTSQDSPVLDAFEAGPETGLA